MDCVPPTTRGRQTKQRLTRDRQIIFGHLNFGFSLLYVKSCVREYYPSTDKSIRRLSQYQSRSIMTADIRIYQMLNRFAYSCARYCGCVGTKTFALVSHPQDTFLPSHLVKLSWQSDLRLRAFFPFSATPWHTGYELSCGSEWLLKDKNDRHTWPEPILCGTLGRRMFGTCLSASAWILNSVIKTCVSHRTGRRRGHHYSEKRSDS